MNAVKRCLALIAATLAVGACSGDPTADIAGADLTIRATPGAIWMGANTTVGLVLEAVDATGGTQPGSWTPSAPVGPITIVVDPTYLPNYTGTAPNSQKYNITSTGEGQGFVVFSGTGGVDTVFVRVAPDPAAFHVTFSNLNPALAAVITATAPAGMRFTAGTSIGFVKGTTNTANNGLAAPSITGYSPDSTVMSILPAPGAAGRISFTGIAPLSTPTLTSDATSIDSVTVPVLSSVAAVISNAAPAINTPITITMPANFKFRPTSALARTAANGDVMSWLVVSRSADSNSVVVYPGPGAVSPVTIGAVQFAPLASLSLGLPTSTNITFALPNMGTDDANVSTATIGQMTAPNAVNGLAVYYDTTSFTGPDHIGDGCAPAGCVAHEMDYLLTVPNAGNYNIKMAFTGATTDLDLFLTSATPVTGANGGDIGFSFLGAGVTESVNFTATAGQTIIVSANAFQGPAVKLIRFVITRTS